MNWEKILDRLGLNSPQWKWRLMKWQRRWEGRRERWQEQRQHVTYRHKFCNRCGALMDREEKVCPACQAPAPSWRAQVIMRALGLVLPKRSPVTLLILGANIVNLLALMSLFGAQNLWQPHSEALIRMGALLPPLFFEGEYWRLLTYGYLHIGLLHIGFNLFALSQVGPFLEEEIGPARFFTLYTLALVGGGVADLLWRGASLIIVAGASGALFGLIGFGMSYAHFRGGTLARQQRNFFFRWAIYGFLFGFLVPAIDNIAHLGGFITGAALGYLVANELINQARLTRPWTTLACLCLIATLLSFAWMLVARHGIGLL
jgi:rhomboid protease GluP